MSPTYQNNLAFFQAVYAIEKIKTATTLDPRAYQFIKNLLLNKSDPHKNQTDAFLFTTKELSSLIKPLKRAILIHEKIFKTLKNPNFFSDIESYLETHYFQKETKTTYLVALFFLKNREIETAKKVTKKIKSPFLQSLAYGQIARYLGENGEVFAAIKVAKLIPLTSLKVCMLEKMFNHLVATQFSFRQSMSIRSLSVRSC